MWLSIHLKKKIIASFSNHRVYTRWLVTIQYLLKGLCTTEKSTLDHTISVFHPKPLTEAVLLIPHSDVKDLPLKPTNLIPIRC